MRVVSATFLAWLLICFASWFSAELAAPPTSPFDQYGTIRWDDERARLDNFAIQLQNIEKAVGFILVYDEAGGCPGEAIARAKRAKRYVVEYRGIPWNRVGWRHEGYQTDIRTTIWIVPEGASVPGPSHYDSVPQRAGPLTQRCKTRLEQIKRSRWK
jgi:hypothetical protein